MGNGRTRVLIIGGGFGGLFCARRLGRVDVDVTLLDRAACHVFQPLLYQCATGTLSIGQISRSLREELARHRNVSTLLGEAVDLDPDARVVTARRPDESTFTLDYDVLIVAVGMRQSYLGHEEFAQWAPGMKTLDDALSVRRTAVRRLRDGRNSAPGTGARRMAHLRHSRWRTHRCRVGRTDPRIGDRALANEFHSIEPEDARVLLFDGGSCVLGSFAPALTGKATKILEHLGVEQHMGVHVTDVRYDGVTVTPEGGRRARGLMRQGPSSGRRALKPCPSRGVSQRCSRPSPTMPDASRWKPTCRCPGIRRSSSSVTSSAATTCREWPRTPCRADCTPPPAFVTISQASLVRATDTAISALPRTSVVDTPCCKPARSSSPGSSGGWAGDSSTSHF